jgi:hypothetical protein
MCNRYSYVSLIVLAWSLLFATILMAAIDFYGLCLLKHYGFTARIVSVDNLSSIRPSYHIEDPRYWTNYFPENDPIVLMHALMDKVSKVEKGPHGNARQLFEYIQQGGGLLCGGMAKLYLTILNAKGIESRLIYLNRALGDRYDSHTTVEVHIKGHWVICDPTFNVNFEKDGYLLGAQDIHVALMDGSFKRINPIFHGEVTYPARLNRYYMHWLPLFNNIFVVGYSDTLWRRLPPLRYWFGPKLYTEPVPGLKYDNLRFNNKLIFLFVVLVPVITLLSFVLSIALLIASKIKYVRHRRRVNIQ